MPQLKEVFISLPPWFNKSWSSSPLQAIILVMAFTTVLNLNTAYANNTERDFLDVPAQMVIKISQSVAPYTPAINEHDEALSYLVTDNQAGLIKKPEVTETIVSVRSYTVEKGDTISTVAEKFGLTVDTILQANGLSGRDTTSIKVGQLLNIPPENTSTSLAWLQEEQKIREERERKARLEAQRRIAQAQSRRVAIRGSSRDVAEGDFDGESTGQFITPVRYKYKGRCALRGHPGQDLPADHGSPVVAADDGKVVERTGGWGSGYGISLIVNHGDGVKTRYAHLSGTEVGAGEQVKQGQVIGYAGNTGFSRGSHLHFDKIVNGQNVRFCF